MEKYANVSDYGIMGEGRGRGQNLKSNLQRIHRVIFKSIYVFIHRCFIHWARSAWKREEAITCSASDRVLIQFDTTPCICGFV